MIDVQAPLVFRLGGQVEPVRAVVLEIADDLPQGGLTVALALLVSVDHEAPEPVAVIRVPCLRSEGKHRKADELFVRIDRKRTRDAGVLRVGLVGLFQGIVVRSHEGLILAHGEGQNRLAVGIVNGSQ